MSSVHFSGIGGTAMIAGARLAVEAGWDVRGSDTPLYPPTSDMVKGLGVPVSFSYEAANLDWRPDVVIIGNALSRGNPEVEAALSRRMRYISLPEWLKENVLRTRRPVAICGTHGKTTTTALTSHILDKGIPDVGYLIGGEALGFTHSARLGAAGAPFVIEGDEYDTAFFDKRAKFLHYLPDIAVVTSIEFDHGDIYRDLEEIETAFQRMLRQVPREGHVFLCADNHARSLNSHAYSNVETYGFAENANWRGIERTLDKNTSVLDVRHDGAPWGTVPIVMAGRHNLSNLLVAIATASRLGMSVDAIIEAAGTFPGVRRRMEVFLEHNGVIFVDDFAHHPTAIRETIAAAQSRWPGRRIRAIFEPRSNTTVTKRFQRELEQAFRAAGDVLLGPIHRKDAIPDEERLDAHALATALQNAGVPAQNFADVSAIVTEITDTMRAGDVVLIMSNGAFGGIYAQFKERLTR